MLSFLIAHVIFSGLLMIFSFIFFKDQWAISFGVGSLFSIFNAALLGFVWQCILNKKRIALAISVIVFKYAFFIVLIYRMATSKSLDLVGLSLGIASIAGVGIVWSFWKIGMTKREENNSGII